MRTLLSMSFALGCSVAAAAQPPSGTAAPQPGTSSAQTVVSEARTPSDAPVTVTGCLRAGEAQNTFILAVLDPSGGDIARNDTTTGAQSPAPTGTSGTAGQSSALPKTMTYQLAPGASAIDLRSHIGQRVQVTGRVQPDTGTAIAAESQSATAAPKVATPGDQTTPVVSTTERTNVKVQRLQVQSLKAVGGSCQ